jgi:hypothetical protein
MYNFHFRLPSPLLIIPSAPIGGGFTISFVRSPTSC